MNSFLSIFYKNMTLPSLRVDSIRIKLIAFDESSSNHEFSNLDGEKETRYLRLLAKQNVIYRMSHKWTMLGFQSR